MLRLAFGALLLLFAAVPVIAADDQPEVEGLEQVVGQILDDSQNDIEAKDIIPSCEADLDKDQVTVDILQLLDAAPLDWLEYTSYFGDCRIFCSSNSVCMSRCPLGVGSCMSNGCCMCAF